MTIVIATHVVEDGNRHELMASVWYNGPCISKPNDTIGTI